MATKTRYFLLLALLFTLVLRANDKKGFAQTVLPAKLQSAQFIVFKHAPAQQYSSFHKKAHCNVYNKKNRKKRGIGGSSLSINGQPFAGAFIFCQLLCQASSGHTLSSISFSRFQRGPPSLG